jgi:hypothetical protein
VNVSGGGFWTHGASKSDQGVCKFGQGVRRMSQGAGSGVRGQV